MMLHHQQITAITAYYDLLCGDDFTSKETPGSRLGYMRHASCNNADLLLLRQALGLQPGKEFPTLNGVKVELCVCVCSCVFFPGPIHLVCAYTD